MLKIECTGLTLRDGRELATYLEVVNGVGEVGLDIDFGEMQTRSTQMSIPHFRLFVHMAEGAAGAIAAGAAGDLGKDLYAAVKCWMARFTNSSVVPVEVKLYGADGRLIEKIERTR